MFPLPWNKAYRKKDGSLSTLDEAISEGGESYTLPTASANTKGGVKIGSGLSMEGEVLKANAQLPASTSADADKVLTVGSDGTPEWATSGGGGGSLVYADFTVTFAVPANSISYTNVQATAATGLVGKRLVSAMLPNNLAGVTIIGAHGQHDPIQEDDWIQVWGAATANPTTVNRVRLWAQ